MFLDILTIFVTVAILPIGNIDAQPFDPAESRTTTEEIYTTGSTTTTTTATTTATTITLPPEIDREWEDLILAGPTFVNYVNLFMVSVSRGDHALTPPDAYTVKYINDIGSLRSTLLQISSAVRSTLKSACDDLVRVQNSINQIPDHIKAALLIIQKAPNNLITQLLPYTIRNVNRAANEGYSVSKPALDRFISRKLLIDELVKLLDHTVLVTEYTDYLTEAMGFANDIQIQWNLLVELFRKFSDRALAIQTSINDNLTIPIDEIQKINGFSSANDRANLLEKLIPASILIDQSSYLLDMMIRTYNEISNDDMMKQMDSTNNYLSLSTEPERITNERELWQNIVSQSIQIARLAQERQNQFVDTSINRQAEYSTYSQNVNAA